MSEAFFRQHCCGWPSFCRLDRGGSDALVRWGCHGAARLRRRLGGGGHLESFDLVGESVVRELARLMLVHCLFSSRDLPRLWEKARRHICFQTVVAACSAPSCFPRLPAPERALWTGGFVGETSTARVKEALSATSFAGAGISPKHAGGTLFSLLVFAFQEYTELLEGILPLSWWVVNPVRSRARAHGE